MRRFLNSIRGLPHAEGARRARLEARTTLLQAYFPIFNQFPDSLEGGGALQLRPFATTVSLLQSFGPALGLRLEVITNSGSFGPEDIRGMLERAGLASPLCPQKRRPRARGSGLLAPGYPLAGPTKIIAGIKCQFSPLDPGHAPDCKPVKGLYGRSRRRSLKTHTSHDCYSDRRETKDGANSRTAIACIWSDASFPRWPASYSR
jgi:hypothetical protein